MERAAGQSAAHGAAKVGATEPPPDAEFQEQREAICALLEQRTGHDFRGYKDGTLFRRIRRRAQLCHAATAREYVRHLEADPGEAARLLEDLLIGVTQFFRDPEAFEALSERVVPALAASRPAGARLRIWAAGCSSGEEAFSLAMIVRERLDALGDPRPVLVLATDIDTETLGRARLGRYPDTIAAHVSEARLARFFVREPGGYLATRELREMCVFSEHDLVRDPPFSSLDLVSCRNVLIYLDAEVVGKLVSLFHYALAPSGYLFLGPAEGQHGRGALFDAVDEASCLFRRRDHAVRPSLAFPLSLHAPARAATAGADAAFAARRAPLISPSFERMLLTEYVPACAVVDEAGNILSWAGRMNRHLDPPPGAPTHNLLAGVHGQLRVELHAALIKARRTHQKVVRERVPTEVDGCPTVLRVSVRPMPDASPESGLFAVVFQEYAAVDEPSAGADPLLDDLERELRTTRAELQTVVEELESANEELKSSNEELISTNEELTSSNEELRASKEEIQSINAQLARNVEELAAANADLSNLFASTHIATLFLDRELRIARFTPAATALFHVVGSDVGRPIADLAPRFRGLDLVADARSVLETRELVERQIEANDSGAWFVVRARPYRTLARDVAGVVVTFVDISDIKRIERELRASEERFAVTFRSAPAPLAIADAETERILDVNAAWTTTFGFTREEALGRTSVELGIVRSPDERARMIELASRGPGAEVPEIPLFARGGRELYVVARSATIEQGGRPCTMSACIDVTGQRRAEEALRRSEQRLRVLIENVSAGVALIDSSGRFSVVNGRFLSLFDLAADADILTVNSQDWSAYEVCDERGQTLEVDEHPVRRAVLRREAVRDQLVSVRPPRGGEPTWMLVSAEPLFDAAGSLECIICTYTDLTERRRAEQAVREERAKLAAALASIPDAVFLCDVEGRFAELNDAFVRYYRFPDRAACPRRMSEYQDLFELTRPDGASVPPDESVVPRALRGETGMNAEYRLRRRDTGESWIGSYSYAPIRADDGVVTGAVIVARDVTQQKEAARALAESEATLRGILDAAKESIWLFGVDGTVLMGNETALSRWPRPASEILGRTPHDLMPPDLAQARAARLREAASGPVEFEDERGGVRFEHRFYPIREADGRVERIAGFSRDITRRWQQERRLEELSRLYLVLSKVNETIVRARDSAELFREVCRIIAEDGGRPLVWIGLLEGRVVVPVAWAGEAHAYVDTLHVEIDGALGERPSATAVREDRPVVDDDFDEDPSLLPWREEAARFRLRASASFPLRRGGVAIGSLTLYAHEPGTFGPEQTGLLEALGADISYALDMMAQAAALRESEQRLREADRRKNEFLAVLSHELRNPLAPIRNSLHILDRAPPGSERALRTKAIIDRQVGQLVRLVDDLLDVTRISNGKIQIQRAPMDLVGLLLRTAEDYRPEFGKAGVSLTTRVGERPVPVFADAPRLAQAVGNLLQNAAKFTPPGGHVTLSLDEEGGCAVVRVRDDGAGIKAAVLERLFQPFTQADETLDRSKGGLGLGLALVKGLMELHGGSVEAASDGLGRGAEFTLRLPLHGEATR